MKKTVLLDKHIKLGAKIVDFAGFKMPISYSSVTEEHNHVRENVGVFDVSHMGEFEISGKNSDRFIQFICSNDIMKLKPGKAQYNCLVNDNGGIIDDLIVYKIEEEKFLLVVNASNIDKDFDWIKSLNKDYSCSINNISDKTSLLAVQGPKADLLCERFIKEDLKFLSNYSFIQGTFAGIDNVIISKTGYTGSGGFELYVSNDNVEHIWDELFSVEDIEVKPIGLAARDTLRLEMGYCLYGNDINESVTPIEANLGWITKVDTNFIGSKSIKEQIENGIKKKLVGFVINDKGIPRKGYEIFDKSENLIGEVTSGTFSPVLKKGIGLAYIENNISSKEIYLKIRNNLIKLEVVKTPFI
jgi:aminomethyltransferase|tara:strand:- start:771 stop:1841 length:1071 start_codon:yes stop_codon:yes gene_type:complete